MPTKKSKRKKGPSHKNGEHHSYFNLSEEFAQNELSAGLEKDYKDLSHKLMAQKAEIECIEQDFTIFLMKEMNIDISKVPYFETIVHNMLESNSMYIELTQDLRTFESNLAVLKLKMLEDGIGAHEALTYNGDRSANNDSNVKYDSEKLSDKVKLSATVETDITATLEMNENIEWYSKKLDEIDEVERRTNDMELKLRSPDHTEIDQNDCFDESGIFKEKQRSPSDRKCEHKRNKSRGVTPVAESELNMYLSEKVSKIDSEPYSELMTSLENECEEVLKSIRATTESFTEQSNEKILNKKIDEECGELTRLLNVNKMKQRELNARFEFNQRVFDNQSREPLVSDKIDGRCFLLNIDHHIGELTCRLNENKMEQKELNDRFQFNQRAFDNQSREPLVLDKVDGHCLPLNIDHLYELYLRNCEGTNQDLIQLIMDYGTRCFEIEEEFNNITETSQPQVADITQLRLMENGIEGMITMDWRNAPSTKQKVFAKSSNVVIGKYRQQRRGPKSVYVIFGELWSYLAAVMRKTHERLSKYLQFYKGPKSHCEKLNFKKCRFTDLHRLHVGFPISYQKEQHKKFLY